MVWSKISFDGLSPTSSSSTQNSSSDEVPPMIPPFVQAPDHSTTEEDNSSTPAPIIPDDDDSSGGLSVTSKGRQTCDGCARGSTTAALVKPVATAVATNFDRKDVFALEMGICSISLVDWCAANRLSKKFLTALQELGADNVVDLLELSDGDRQEMVQETELRFVEKKKLLKALSSDALNTYYQCVLDARSMAEYKDQLETDLKRASDTEVASGWLDDFDTKPIGKPVRCDVPLKEEDNEIGGNIQGNDGLDADLDALEAQDGREVVVCPPLKRHLIQVPLVEESKRDGPWKTIVMIGETGTAIRSIFNLFVLL